MKKLLVFTVFLSVFGTYGQIRGVTEKGSGLINLEQQQLTFNLFNPSIRYELGVFRNQSVSVDLGLGAATYSEGYALGLALNNRYRYYHNFQRRLDRNKNVSGNSGNYIAAAQAIFFSQVRIATNIEGPSDFNIGFYGMVYGVQRTYAKGFNFNAEIGAGYYRGDGVPSDVGPLVTFKFGWVATKRKSTKPVFD